MKETTLRDFLVGEVDAAALRLDLQDSTVRRGPFECKHSIQDMPGSFEVEPHHLIRLCDAVLSGALDPALLHPIGFCLVASDAFCWDGDTDPGARVAEVVHDWSAPEVNLPLTADNAALWRAQLLGDVPEARQ